MYELFKHKRMMPSDFYFKKYGEKLIIEAFLEQEVKEHNDEIKAMERR